MDRFARLMLRHRRWVIVFWLVALVAGGAAAGQVTNRLSYNFSLPGQEGSQTADRLTASYGVAAQVAAIPVLTAAPGRRISDERAAVADVAATIRAVPGVQVLDYGSTGDPKFLTDDGRSTFILVYAPQPHGFGSPLPASFDSAVAASAHRHGLDAQVTGYNQLRASERLGVQGTMMFRLGHSDTSIWRIWDATRPDDAMRQQLEDIPPGPDLIRY